MSSSPQTAVRLREVIADVLDLNPVLIGDSFSRGDSPAWDSLAHLRLITALEEAFGIKFTMKEVGEMDCYEKIRERIDRRS
jgi:acyl carrier protein